MEAIPRGPKHGGALPKPNWAVYPPYEARCLVFMSVHCGLAVLDGYITEVLTQKSDEHRKLVLLFMLDIQIGY